MTMIAEERPVLARSLWSATAHPAPPAPPLQETITADVAVVGAGYTGLSAAIHLADRGANVVVLDAQSPGWGASGRNGGQVIPGLKEDPDTIEQLFGPEMGGRMVRLAGESADLVFGLIERFGIACDAARHGWIQPAHSAKALAASETRVRQWQRRGAPVEALSAADAERLIGTPAYAGGLLDRRGGSLHPLDYALGLARAAQGLGVRIHGESRVERVARTARGFRLRAGKGEVVAERVLLCTNGYTDGLDDRLRRSVVPVHSVQLATRPLSDNVRRSILPGGQVASDTRRLLLYYRISPDGRFVMGGRGAYGDHGIQRQMERLRVRAQMLFPQLAGIEWEHHWGGRVAMTGDHFPHLHECEPGLIAALGYNGRGVAMATAMGGVLAAKASGAADGEIDFPVSPVTPIPLHVMRKPMVSAMIAWNALRDRTGL